MMKALQLLGRISAFVAAFVALFIVLTGPFVIILTEKNAALETIADATGALAVVLASWLCARRLDHRRLDEIGFSLRALIPLIFGGILLGAAMSAGALVALRIEHGWLIGEGVRITNPLLAEEGRQGRNRYHRRHNPRRSATAGLGRREGLRRRRNLVGPQARHPQGIAEVNGGPFKLVGL